MSWDGANVHFFFGIPRGMDGVSSPPINSFIIDGVSTLNPGEPATVQTSFDGASVRFTFGIPRGSDGMNGSNGSDGAQGQPGNNGSDGGQGPQGAQGPPFANALVDGVTTLNPGDNATVQTSFDGSNVRFQFGIPRGQNGSDGGTGPQGAPGEVTNAKLSSAIASTSNGSNGVNTLGMAVSDPPTQGEVQAIASKLDELILALRR